MNQTQIPDIFPRKKESKDQLSLSLPLSSLLILVRDLVEPSFQQDSPKKLATSMKAGGVLFSVWA